MRLNEDVRLTGEHCLLVPYVAAMVPTYHGWMQDPQLLELTGSEPLSLEEEYKMQASWQLDADKLTFIVLDPTLPADTLLGDACEGGGMVGDVNVFFPTARPSDSAPDYTEGEVEVMIAVPEARRRGLAREALSLIMAFCVRELSTERFVAKIKEHNAPSVALFEKLGFSLLRRQAIFQELVYAREMDDRGEGSPEKAAPEGG
mmetsp:Transcript_21417/g.47485  ORF Transcript_21417/g.47485 Transcript_21417/m.47485 type:complete len:203 (+) Transcript_21417:44-652(+)